MNTQSGPCVCCDKKDYPLSVGGPSICPYCDAGICRQKHSSNFTAEDFLDVIREAGKEKPISLKKLLESRYG